MRLTLALLVIGTGAAAALAQAQTAVTTQTAATQQAASRPAATRASARRPAPVLAEARTAGRPRTARSSTATRSKPLHQRPATHVTTGGAPAGKGDGVLALGASDITGNKELPKVMVIVPWKSPTDAGGVVAPTDSVMNEVLGPVDRGVFQRRIRYYGQINAAGERAPAQAVAPVGDSH
jgi:hypothetical protein